MKLDKSRPSKRFTFATATSSRQHMPFFYHHAYNVYYIPTVYCRSRRIWNARRELQHSRGDHCHGTAEGQFGLLPAVAVMTTIHHRSTHMPSIPTVTAKSSPTSPIIAKHLCELSLLFPHQCGISTTPAAQKQRNISSMLKLKPASNAAARI